MREAKEWRRILIAGVVAGVIVSCGPTGIEMLGDAMVDAGTMLTDGGDAMTPDAQAQACAMNCSAAGTQRILTAETDPMQLEWGVSGTSGGPSQVVEGPFVLTDAQTISYGTGTRSVATLHIRSASEGCASVVTLDITNIAVVAYDRDATAERAIHGARYFVGAGQVLCVAGNATIGWAGFRPYD